jgi:hypothetical protein
MDEEFRTKHLPLTGLARKVLRRLQIMPKDMK